MVRERGSGITPPKIVELLKGAVEKKSKLAVAKETGLGIAAISRYVKGIGEPTTATLEKLAEYFNTSVAHLRGENRSRHFPAKFQKQEIEMFEEHTTKLLELYDISGDKYKSVLAIVLMDLCEDIHDLLIMHVKDVEIENQKVLEDCWHKLTNVIDKHMGIDSNDKCTIRLPSVITPKK